MNAPEHIRVFEAFAGYGSQAMALKKLSSNFPDVVSFEFIGTSEIEKNAIKAYGAVHNVDDNFGDISKINWNDVPDFDLFTYSFPCQDISNAGLQKGFKKGSGSRSSLLWECCRAIESKKPKYLLMENVKALVQEKFTKDFARWVDWLEGQGYKNFWAVLNSKDYGIPQNRERVFMASFRNVEATDPFFQYVWPAPFKLEKRLKDVLESNVDERYYLKDEQVERIMEHCDRKVAEGCGFKTNFIDACQIDYSIPFRLVVEDTTEMNNFPSYNVFISRNCTVKEFIEGILKIWKGNKNIGEIIFENLKFPDLKTALESELIVVKHAPVSGYLFFEIWPDRWQWRFSNFEVIDPKDYTGTITGNYGQRETDTYIKEPKVMQVGNLIPDEEGKFSNPERGRVYSPEGIAPCQHTCGGGNLEPKIVVPINTTKDGCSSTIAAHYGWCGWSDFRPKEQGNQAPHTGIMEVISCASRKRGDEHKIEMGSDVANAVTTVNTDSMVAEPKPRIIGHYHKSEHNASAVLDPEGISPTVMENHGTVNAVVEKDPTFLRYGFGHGQQGASKDVAFTVNASAFEHNNFIVEKEQKGMMYKGKFVKEGDGLDLQRSEQWGQHVMDGISPSVRANKTNAGVCVNTSPMMFRIRKLTEREVFRLMDVSEEDIDKIQASGISRSAQYKLAGNSIVVNVLYHIFRKMFVEKGPERGQAVQLSLF